MNSAKKRAIILMVSGAVIGAVAVGAYLLQGNTMSPTAETPPTATSTPSIFDMEPIIPEAKVSTEGWKTCRNEEYGYEFQFPGEWHIYGEDAYSNSPEGRKRYIVRESKNCNGATVLVSSADVPSGGGGLQEIHTSTHVRNIIEERKTWNKDYPLTLEELYEASRNQYLYKIYLLDNRQALLRIDSLPLDQIPTESWSVDVYIDIWRYHINLGGRSQDSVRNTHETILSTFRFLDTATSSIRTTVQ